MISYPEQLETQEWRSKREQIIVRDNSTCQFCGRQESRWSTPTIDGRIYNIGVDTSVGAITKDMLELGNIKHRTGFNSEISDESSWEWGWPIDNYLLILSNRMFFSYVINPNPNIDKFKEEKELFRVVRVRIPSRHHAYVFFKDERDLENLRLPIYYCQEEIVKLNVHHKFYVIGRMAWDYSDDTLITLCDQCHSNIHKCSDVKVYTAENGKQITMNYTPCKRCGSVGYFPEYKKIQNGICFRCRGNRFEELIPN